MRETTIGRNYAAALLELGNRHDEAEAYGPAFRALAAAIEGDARVRRFMETPRVSPSEKQAVLRRALGDRVPERFVRFVLVVLSKGRQRLLAGIGAEYQTLLDQQLGRVHAEVTLAREPDEATEREIAEGLSRMLGLEVRPHITVNPAILGGLVVRYGDRLMDGSLRRQLVSLRREMMGAHLPDLPAASA